MRMFLRTYILAVLLFLTLGVNTANTESMKKLKVDDVSFTGIKAFTTRHLSHVMITRESHFLRSFHYNEEVFQEDLKALELFYHQNGYLDAVTTDYHVQVDSTRFKAYIKITISEGELTHVEGVSVLGNNVFPDSLLLEKISILQGEPFQPKKIEDSTVNILTFYADHGYLDAEVQPDIKINTEMNRALVDFNIKEKVPFTIGDIHLKGLEKTRKNVAMRELLFNPGEVVNYSLLLKSQRNIYMTGLFQSVFIRPQTSVNGDSTKKDILVDVKENISGEFNMAFGYGSVERVRGKMEVYNNNVRGTSLKLGLVGTISFIQHSIEMSFTNPWTLGTPMRTDMNLIQENKDEPGYDLSRIGGKMIIGRRFQNNNITLTYRHENTKLSNIKVKIITDTPKSNTRSLKLSFINDTRDNLFNSTKGVFFETSGEFGGFFTSRTIKFYRIIGQLKYYYPLNPHTVIATSLESGLMDAEGGFGLIPLHERFYAGGPNSLRSFEYEKVGPLDIKRVPIGGKLKFVWNILEVRRTLYKMIGGVVFADIGNVWLKPDNVSLGDLRTSLGLGLRISTPIGLARLDYGINTDRRKGEPQGQVYFSMGQAF